MSVNIDTSILYDIDVYLIIDISRNFLDEKLVDKPGENSARRFGRLLIRKNVMYK